MLIWSFANLSPSSPPISLFKTPPRCRISNSIFHPHSLPKTSSPNAPNNDFMADYLVNSLGFSRQEAISASAQVNHLKSSKKPDLVLELFGKYGFDKTQIRKIVSSSPRVLLHKVEQTLEPKLKVLLEDIGFSGSDLVKLIKKNPGLLTRGLNTCILPTVSYLKEVLADDEKVVQSLRESPWLLSSPSALKRMQRNVVMLQKHGLSIENIRKFIISNPRDVLQKPEWIEDALSRVDNELGIPRDSAMFLPGVRALASVSKATLDKKLEIFRSFGWSNADIMNMGRSQPYSLTMSEDRIHNVLNFYMKELGYPPEYLASHACLLMYSLAKRVKPRYKVLKVLRENKLVDVKPGLYSVLLVPESTFLGKYVLCYTKELPNLYEIYNNALKR